MKAFFINLKRPRFYALAIIFCALGDIAFATLVYHKFAIYENFQGPLKEALALASAQNPSMPSQFSPAMIKEIFQLMRLTVIGSLGLVFVIHSIVYLGLWFQKSFSFYYVKMMSWLGPLFCLLLFIQAFNTAEWGKLYFGLQAFLFVFVAIGLHFYPLEKETK